MNPGFIARLLVVVGVTLVSTFLHGEATFRWGVPASLLESDQQVKDLPKEIGEWKSSEDADRLRQEVIDELGVTEYISRIYARGQDTLSLLLLSGRTGRLIRHSPEICYGATGNQFLAKPTEVPFSVDGVEHRFRILSVRPASDATGDFVVVYGFAQNGQFLSPENPRLVYHGTQAIQKIQVLCRAESGKVNEIPEYAKSFIEDICRSLAKSPAK